MGFLGAASEKAQYELMPTGEYVLTLWDLSMENGQYGDTVKWTFLLSKEATPDAYLERNDGLEKTLWQFTNPGLPRGSRAREWTEALLGRELRTGEEPDEDDLIRRRMVGYIQHKPNKKDPTIKREAIAEGSCRPFGKPSAPAADEPTPISATPTQSEIDAELNKSDALRAEVKKLIRRAAIAEVGDYETWSEITVENENDARLRKLKAEIEKAMQAEAAAV